MSASVRCPRWAPRRGSGGGAETPYGYLGLIATRLVPADLRLILRAGFSLPPRVAWFYVRAYALARRHHDQFSVAASARPEDLGQLLATAKGRRYVVELGTATAWTAVALALADTSRQVVSYDPVLHPQRAQYLRLAGADARARIRLRVEPGESGPADDDPPADLLFIDISRHERADTIAAFDAWRDALAPDAVVAFHDYSPQFPGVAEAVDELGLRGSLTGQTLFVWRTSQSASE